MSVLRAWPPLVVASALTLVCAVVAGVSAGAAGAELTRGPSAAEIRRASAEETARRWQAWPAGKIFPATLPYVSEQGGGEYARRVGISSRTDCSAAVDAALRIAMRDAGCRAVLRATYLDALQGVVVTVGVAAFPDQASALKARAAFPPGGVPSPGLRALAFPRTVADRFTAASRQASSIAHAGPYVVVTTAGQVDGRPARAVGRQRGTIFSFASDLAERVLATLTAPARPDCAGKDWQC
ncbi:hypothetical protein Sme01_12630 [Sphaerisporangium melleum]|uniref:Secreted protein n=1 Tax=Sphaerisporangium melleum TaxID=321316 RepID=A0A917RJ02_9ACTN|nr:hypothetical protein [Sphaerisporangium melleum]GGL08788.1 hypothetical protein GCM10007964_58800 [Sphaerisporangium melleum]GII68787.1 hypothetical protein Sme01_12630 [Sphaerisporangium melleum]